MKAIRAWGTAAGKITKISVMTEISVHSDEIEAYSKAIAKRCTDHN